MAKLRRKNISKRTIESLAVAKDTVFWDSELSGFGVRVYPSGSKVYIVQTRARGLAAKRVTVGRRGITMPEEARRRAALIVARIKSGEEPAPERIVNPAPDRDELEPTELQADVSWETLREAAERIGDRIENGLNECCSRWALAPIGAPSL